MFQKARCGNSKATYDDEESANRALFRIWKTTAHQQAKTPTHHYYCQKCEGFHLTSQVRWK